jgi:hypothetical protein
VVLTLIPHAVQQGEHVVIVPHGIEETKILRNLGMQVPAPIVSNFDRSSAPDLISVRRFKTFFMVASSTQPIGLVCRCGHFEFFTAVARGRSGAGIQSYDE